MGIRWPPRRRGWAQRMWPLLCPCACPCACWPCAPARPPKHIELLFTRVRRPISQRVQLGVQPAAQAGPPHASYPFLLPPRIRVQRVSAPLSPHGSCAAAAHHARALQMLFGCHMSPDLLKETAPLAAVGCGPSGHCPGLSSFRDAGRCWRLRRRHACHPLARCATTRCCLTRTSVHILFSPHPCAPRAVIFDSHTCTSSCARRLTHVSHARHHPRSHRHSKHLPLLVPHRSHAWHEPQRCQQHLIMPPCARCVLSLPRRCGGVMRFHSSVFALRLHSPGRRRPLAGAAAQPGHPAATRSGHVLAIGPRSALSSPRARSPSTGHSSRGTRHKRFKPKPN